MVYKVVIEHVRTKGRPTEIVNAPTKFQAAMAALKLKQYPKQYMYQNPPYRIWSIETV